MSPTYSTAERTDIAGKDITVTNTTGYVMFASQKTRRVGGTTCAAVGWSACLDFVGQLCLEEPKERSAGKTENVVQVFAVWEFTGSQYADSYFKRAKIVLYRKEA